MSTSYEECNLDLSGRFADSGMMPLPKLVSVCTQTSVTDVEMPAVRISMDRATSTEGNLSGVHK